MKHFLSSILLTAASISLVSAQSISLRTSIFAGSNGGTYSSPAQHSIHTTGTVKRVHLKTNITTNPNLTMALSDAEDLFSQQMKDMGIDLVPIDAFVKYGEAGWFENDEVCQIDVKYTDSLGYNPLYSYFGNSLDYSLPCLFPRTIYNQSRGCKSDTCMVIWLNPEIPLSYGTIEQDLDSYDAVTIMMRALAIGCGIQSSFSPFKSPQYGITYKGQLYVTIFDSRIYNDVGVSFNDVAHGFASDATFLNGHKIYANGYYQPVQLTNEWEMGIYDPLTNATYNTIDWQTYSQEEMDRGFVDLLETEIPPAYEIHEITPYTKELLKGLGWMETLAVGFNNPYADLYKSRISCNGTVLAPNTTYKIQINNRNINIEDITSELNSMDSVYTIGIPNNSEHTFMYKTLPNNVQWERDNTTKNIVGHIKTKAWVDGNGGTIQQEKICDIQIPYRPNSPLVNKKERVVNDAIQLDLSAFSNGSKSYTIAYTGVNDLATHTITTTAFAIDTILADIPATQLYNMVIYGTNNMGNSDTCKFVFGQSANPTLYMTTSVIGNTLRYDLSRNGTVDLSWVTVTSVFITDAMGNILLNPGAVDSGDPINISSLKRGYYLLNVIANGHTYTKKFGKK